MLKSSSFAVAVLCLFSTLVVGQNSNSSTTTNRPRSTNTNSTTQTKSANTNKPANNNKAGAAQKSTETTTHKATEPTGSEAVQAAFNKIIDGIRHSDVKAVTSGYWNSRDLVLFNNNGTVTKGWEQLRKNRESSYPDLKDVKLEIHDAHVMMLGRDGAVVSCLWTQSQTYKGAPETATGRMTLVFKRIGTDWKAVHLHTSPDKPDTSRVLPSEQVPASSPSPKP